MSGTVIDIRAADVKPTTSYDLGIATLGFETRATHAWTTLVPHCKTAFAVGFMEQQVLAYDRNRQWFQEKSVDVVETDDEAFRGVVADLFRQMSRKKDCRIFLDISSLSRLRIAMVIAALSELSASMGVIVDFVYSLAMFPGSAEPPHFNAQVGPVIPEFAGAWKKPELPVNAIVGLGCEAGKALGAIEHIQATGWWLFLPSSTVGAYRRRMVSSNEVLIREGGRSRCIEYDVADIPALFSRLRVLVDGISYRGNIVIFPFGPKVFALAACLLAVIQKDISVWRVSGGAQEHALDRLPAGDIYSVTVRFGFH